MSKSIARGGIKRDFVEHITEDYLTLTQAEWKKLKLIREINREAEAIYDLRETAMTRVSVSPALRKKYYTEASEREANLKELLYLLSMRRDR